MKEMCDSMTSTNSSGTSDGPYPSGANKDSLFGQDTSLGGYIDNGQAVFHFSNLDADTIYDFTFYASRLGLSDNRETRYQLKGANSSSVDLDPAGNTDQVAKVSGIHPDASGEIELCISKGPNNNNSEGFYYLGAMQIDVRNAIEAQVFRPVKLGNTVIIDWIGAGSLQWTNDLTKPWKGYMIEPVAPTIESPLIENQRFYRLSN